MWKGEKVGSDVSEMLGSLQHFLRTSVAISPGMTDIVFKARRTLKVRSAETLPRSTNSVTYL